MGFDKSIKENMSKNVFIRLVRKTDLQQIYEIEMRSFKTPFSFFTLQTLFWFNKEYFYVAEIDGKLVGYIIGDVRGNHGHIISIAVDAQHRREGIGRSLMKVLIKKFKEMNIKTIRLEVAVSNMNAQIFYKKMGFRTIDCIKNYYSNGEDAFLMEKRL